MKCPVCQRVHPDRDLSPSSCSHGALVVYTSATCPICLDETTPMVALPCGHVLCKSDFGILGGYIRPTTNDSSFDDGEAPTRVTPDRYELIRTIPRYESPAFDLAPYTSSTQFDEQFVTHFPRVFFPRSRTDEDDDSRTSSSESYYSTSSDENTDWCEDESVDDDDTEESSVESETTSDSSEERSYSPISESSSRNGERTRAQTLSAAPSVSLHSPNETCNLFTRRRKTKGGAWILVPTDDINSQSTLIYSINGVLCRAGEYARASKLILDGNGGVLVYSPLGVSADGSSRTWGVWHANLHRSTMKYVVYPRSQVVSDGCGGIWTLHGSLRRCQVKQLMFWNAQYPDGRKIMMVPTRSQLISDHSGGVWIHVRHRSELSSDVSSSPDSLKPGLWHVRAKSHTFRTDLHPDAKCVADHDGGLWALSPPLSGPTGNGPYELTRIRDVAIEQIRMVVHSKDAVKIISDHRGGLYVHDLKDGRWTLSYVTMRSAAAAEVCPCPRDAQVVGNGNGDLWVLKRNTRTAPFRSLWKVTSGEASDEDTFPLGSILPCV